MIGMPPMLGSACNCGMRAARKDPIPAAEATLTALRNALKLAYDWARSHNVGILV